MSDFTNKQKAFIEAYLGEARFNAVEAARLAGYTHAESSSRDLMAKGYKVRKEIERRLEEYLPSESELLAELTRLAMANPGDEWVRASDKRNALVNLLELKGRILNRVEHTGSVKYSLNLPTPTNDHDTNEND